jgi:hypothetical protein
MGGCLKPQMPVPLGGRPPLAWQLPCQGHEKKMGAASQSICKNEHLPTYCNLHAPWQDMAGYLVRNYTRATKKRMIYFHCMHTSMAVVPLLNLLTVEESYTCFHSHDTTSLV